MHATLDALLQTRLTANNYQTAVWPVFQYVWKDRQFIMLRLEFQHQHNRRFPDDFTSACGTGAKDLGYWQA